MKGLRTRLVVLVATLMLTVMGSAVEYSPKGRESKNTTVRTSTGTLGRNAAWNRGSPVNGVVNVGMDYPSESNEDASLFSGKDEMVRGYLCNRNNVRSGTYLLTDDGMVMEESGVKSARDVMDLQKASSVVTEVALDRNMTRDEEAEVIANAASEAFKKTSQYGDWKFRMKSKIAKASYTNEDLVPGYVLVRYASGLSQIFRINPKRMFNGEMRDVTSGDYYTDRKNSFLRDRRFLNAAEAISAARTDPEYDRMMQAIDDTFALQGDIGAHPVSKQTCRGSNPLFPELDKRICRDVGEKSGMSDVKPKPVSIEELQKLDFDNPNGDWCKCANPGCVNTVKEVDGKHIGCVGFECSRCKKINVKFAKEALELSRIAKEEGVPMQWTGANAEEKANAAARAVR